MEDVFSLFNHPKDFIDLPAKDFSEVLFFSLKEMAKNCNGKFGTYSLVSHFQSHYKLSHKWEIDCAITQALQELEHSKLIARKLVNGSSASVYENWIITKLGEATESKSDLHEIQQRNRLQVNSLHPDIAEQCYGDYFRGYYESAVFKAYKAVASFYS